MLWLYLRIQLKNDIGVHNQTGVILTIKRVCDNRKKSQALKNSPLKDKDWFHDINWYDSDYIISCSTTISSVANTLNNIYLVVPLWDEFTYEYYNDKNDDFAFLFQQYKSSAV